MTDLVAVERRAWRDAHLAASILCIVCVILFFGMGFEAKQADKYAEAATNNKYAAEQWKAALQDIVRKASEGMELQHRIIAGYQANLDVCVSMLPADQRRSFKGEP